jgi:hypothetical protein
MDIPLLPSVDAGYLPTVDLDAAVAALAPRLVAYATGRTGCRSTGEDVAQDALHCSGGALEATRSARIAGGVRVRNRQ